MIAYAGKAGQSRSTQIESSKVSKNSTVAKNVANCCQLDEGCSMNCSDNSLWLGSRANGGK